jgi:hypothetical protein
LWDFVLSDGARADTERAKNFPEKRRIKALIRQITEYEGEFIGRDARRWALIAG